MSNATSDQFFAPQMKKASKTATAKLYHTEKWDYLQLYLLYCYFIIQSLMFIKNLTIIFNIRLSNYGSG